MVLAQSMVHIGLLLTFIVVPSARSLATAKTGTYFVRLRGNQLKSIGLMILWLLVLALAPPHCVESLSKTLWGFVACQLVRALDS